MTTHLREKLLVSVSRHCITAVIALGALVAGTAFAADSINGQVVGAGAPIVASTVTLALMTVLGSRAPANAVVNEMTTVASVWTLAQFLDGDAIKGNTLGLKIAASNVPNFVDLQTGGWGTAIQDPLNSSQTPTMANFATLADMLSACVTRVTAEASNKLFAAATPPVISYVRISSIMEYRPRHRIGLRTDGGSETTKQHISPRSAE